MSHHPHQYPCVNKSRQTHYKFDFFFFLPDETLNVLDCYIYAFVL